MLSGYFNSDNFFKHILIGTDLSNIQLSSKVIFLLRKLNFNVNFNFNFALFR